jgi:hypothetical protein
MDQEGALVAAKTFASLALLLVAELIDKFISLALAIRHSAREFAALRCCGYFTKWIANLYMLS